MAKKKNLKSGWEAYVKRWHKLKHPIVPGKVSLVIYKKLVRKYVKGNRALLLGATWQLRDLLAEIGFKVTAIDTSRKILDCHTYLCRSKNRKERLIVANWLSYSPKEKFDLVIGDAANFQLPEKYYDKFFKQVSTWLKPTGVSVQLLEGNHNDSKAPLHEIISYLKKTTRPGDYLMRAYYYLAYLNYKHHDRYANIAEIEHDLLPYVEKGIVPRKKFNTFSLGLNQLNLALVPRKRIEDYVGIYLDIEEKVAFGNTFVERAFYWVYVMKPKEKINKSDLAYIQRKSHLYLTPFTWAIGRSFSSSAIMALKDIRPKKFYALYNKDHITWYGIKEALSKSQELCTKEIIKNPHLSKKIRNTFKKKAIRFIQFMDRIEKINYPNLSNSHLYWIYDKFYEIYADTYGWAEPPAWFTQEGVTSYLKEYLVKKVNDKHLAVKYLNILASMPETTFIKREEIKLLKIAFQIKKKPSLRKKLIENHAKKWFWIPYDYGVMIWDYNHFHKELNNALKANPTERLKELIDKNRLLLKEQKSLARKLQVDKHHQLIFNAMRDFAFLMDYKKEIFTKGHYQIRPLLQEIGRRLKLGTVLVQFLTPSEVKEALLYGIMIDKKWIIGRKKLCLMVLDEDGEYRLLDHSQALEFKKKIAEKERIYQQFEIKGACGSEGYYKGRVRVILNAKQIHKIKDGDILVTAMTSPDYTSGIKKAGAIITDEGGITCHAAIVSREMGIPCVIGTKTSTKALKNGQYVEVDANDGIVRILN